MNEILTPIRLTSHWLSKMRQPKYIIMVYVIMVNGCPEISS